ETRLATLPPRIESTQPENAASNSFDVLSQQAIGQLITWVFIPLVGTSGLFVNERMRGTLRRMVTTPTSKATFMGGAILGQILKAMVQMLLIILVGAGLYGISYANNPLALLIVLLSFALAGTALGTMLGTFVKSDGQATGLSIMTGMVMSMLGGCWFPLELFPPSAQTVARFLPTRWALVGIQDLVVRGQGVSDILLESGVLLLFAAVFFTIGIWRFRYE
ncbi:MAG: ABC transporter permease, partial [Candidatus Promineifilaceae bacterium]